MAQELRLVKLFQILGERFNADSLDERIIGQKKTYFMQEFGIKLDYKFRWYIYGPYSFRLGSQAFEIAALYDRYPHLGNAKDPLTREYPNQLQRVANFCGSIRNLPQIEDTDLKNERFWQELASSVHFLIKKAVPPASNIQEVVQTIEDKKPVYEREHVETAVDVLKDSGLVDRGFD